MPTPRLWIVITRPDSLVDALAVASLCKTEYLSCHLLYEESSWWRRAQWENYKSVFDGGVITCAKVNTCRGLRDMPRMYRDLVARQRQLESLEVSSDDTIVCLSGVIGLANALASAYPRTPKTLIVTKKKYDDSNRAPDLLHYRRTTSSWFQFYLLEPLVGVGRTIQLKPRRKQGGDGVRITRLQQPLEKVFQAIVVLSNTGRELPAAAGPSLFAAPFVDLNDFAPLLPPSTKPPEVEASQGKRMVFFGTPFLLVRNLPPEQYAKILNDCLDYLRCHYGERCQLVYRPHPAETKEQQMLHLEGFTFEGDQEVAQLYFLKHLAEMEAVFSVSSTVSRVALNYGLNGYAMWRCFPFGREAVAYFETLMGGVPPAFDIRSLAEPPVPYARYNPAEDKAAKFSGALHRALDFAARYRDREKAVAPHGENAR